MRTTTHIRIEKQTKELLDEIKDINEKIENKRITYDALLRDLVGFENGGEDGIC